MKRIINILFALVLALSFSLVTAVPVGAQLSPTVTFRTGGTGTAAWTAEQAHSGLHSAKMTTTTTSDWGMVRFEFASGQLKLDDLTTLSYWEYVSARANPLDVFIDIWLDFNGDGVATTADYPGYMQAEPYYTSGAAPLNTWTQINAMNLMWSTYAGPDDPYHAPTIPEFQANVHSACVHGYNMTHWTNGYDFGPMSILRIDIRVGYGGTWANFTGYADDIAINGFNYDFQVQTCGTATCTGTGTASFTPSTGSITGLSAVAEGSLPPAAQATKPGDFPDGLFSFNITGLSPGQAVNVTITLPGSAPTQYWKYHTSEGGWIQIPMTIVGPPNVIKITLVDGAKGDDDQTQNGVIVDQGGPSGYPVGWETYPVSKVRVLAPWIALGVAVAAGASLLVLRRRRAQS